MYTCEYLRKGSQVYIEGSLRTRKWQDKQGNDRYSTEIVGNDLQMLGGRAAGAGAAGAGGGPRGGAPPGSREPYPESAAWGAAATGAGEGGEDFDDDIPF